MRVALLLALTLGLVGCASSRPPWPPAPADVLAAVETRTVEAPTVRVDYHITASGAFTADLEGTLGLGRFDRALLLANGTFGGAPQRLVLTAEKQAMRGLRADSVAFTAAQPPALRDALVLGLTRMGLLHNLARLVAGQPPDHAEKGVEGWIEPTGVAWGPTGEIDGRAAQALEFTLRVDGTDAADVTLWLDAETGWPVGRDQTVAFPDGTMTVEERYAVWSLREPPFPD
jgi:hypothetical protein